MNQCYEFEKWTMVSLALVAASLTIGLFMLATKASAATSLDELQGEVNEAQTYRGELKAYMSSHNMTATDGILLDTYQMENLVRAHIADCNAGLTVMDGDC
jgi:hypothetical protein